MPAFGFDADDFNERTGYVLLGIPLEGQNDRDGVFPAETAEWVIKLLANRRLLMGVGGDDVLSLDVRAKEKCAFFVGIRDIVIEALDACVHDHEKILRCGTGIRGKILEATADGIE